ncbi:hypothetical protein DXG01_015740 [Tephrocybe rancida]|nr:hypothetical protein DXG01_015740 [Tephrocybe rancida]
MDVNDDSLSRLPTTSASSYPPSVVSNQAMTSRREDTRTSGNQDQMAPAHCHSPECQTKGGKATSVSKSLQYRARDKGKQHQKEEEVECPTAPTDKGKGKAKENGTSSSEDEQVAVLLQCMYNAGVPEHVTAAVLSEPLVQLAVAHLLDELELAHHQHDDARSWLFQFTSSSQKREALPPTTLPQPKKAHPTEPTEVVESTSQEGVSHVREQPLPYKDVVALTAEPMQVDVPTHQEQDSAFSDADPVDELAKKKNRKSKVEVPSATVPVRFEANVPHPSDKGDVHLYKSTVYKLRLVYPEAQVVPHNDNPPPPPVVPVTSTSQNVVPGEDNESDYGSDFMEMIYDDDTVKEQCCKEAANKTKTVKLEKAAKDKEKALMRLKESQPGPIPVGWETVKVNGCWEQSNNFNGILSPYFYLSYQTNTVDMGWVLYGANKTWQYLMTRLEDKYRCLEAQLDHPGSPQDRVETRVAVATVDPTQVPLPMSPSPISATALGSPMEQVIPSGTEKFFDLETESTDWLEEVQQADPDAVGKMPRGSLPPTP